MTIRNSSLAFSLTVAFLPWGCGTTVTDRPQVQVGMTKAEVSAALGEPAEKKTNTKQSEHIWGPPEEWWDELEMGDAFETWSYKYPGEGTYSVYFLRGEQTVSHISFTEEGIVYESGS